MFVDMTLPSILLASHLSVFTRRLQTSEGSMAQINILIQKPGLMVLYFISTHYAAVILCQILLSCVCVRAYVFVCVHHLIRVMMEGFQAAV